MRSCYRNRLPVCLFINIYVLNCIQLFCKLHYVRCYITHTVSCWNCQPIYSTDRALAYKTIGIRSRVQLGSQIPNAVATVPSRGNWNTFYSDSIKILMERNRNLFQFRQVSNLCKRWLRDNGSLLLSSHDIQLSNYRFGWAVPIAYITICTAAKS